MKICILIIISIFKADLSGMVFQSCVWRLLPGKRSVLQESSLEETKAWPSFSASSEGESGQILSMFLSRRNTILQRWEVADERWDPNLTPKFVGDGWPEKGSEPMGYQLEGLHFWYRLAAESSWTSPLPSPRF